MADLLALSEMVQLWRSITIGMGGVVLGMAAFVVVRYAPKARKGGALPRHIALIATSYCIIVATQVAVQADFLLERHPPTFRLLVNPVAYLLGIQALRCIMVDIRRRG